MPLDDVKNRVEDAVVLILVAFSILIRTYFTSAIIIVSDSCVVNGFVNALEFSFPNSFLNT